MGPVNDREVSIGPRGIRPLIAAAIAIAGIIAPASAGASLVGDVGDSDVSTPYTCNDQTATQIIRETRATIRKAWNVRGWRNAKPSPAELFEIDQGLRCLERKADRRKITRYRAGAKQRFFEIRRQMLDPGLYVPPLPYHGRHWVAGSHPNSAEGYYWTTDEWATLLWQLGGSRGESQLLSTKLYGESGSGNGQHFGGDPKAHGPPDGKGLGQIEVQFHPELRHLALFKPRPNGIGVLHVLRKQGIAAWYGRSGPPGRILLRLTR